MKGKGNKRKGKKRDKKGKSLKLIFCKRGMVRPMLLGAIPAREILGSARPWIHC